MGPTNDLPDRAKVDLTKPVSDVTDARVPKSPTPAQWIRTSAQVLLPPSLLIVAGVVLILALGAAQRLGWIQMAAGTSAQTMATDTNVPARYVCPMMCTPPQSEPGRCPVCAMELEPATTGGTGGDERAVNIDPASRRLANIRTATVELVNMQRTIQAIGELSYDEGSLRTIAAYVDGRLEKLYADYTGVNVKQGDHLALVYSPDLYSSQVELLLARDALKQSSNLPGERIVRSNQDVYDSARRRLRELGMTPAQIETLEQVGESNSRMHLCAPISGTVIEKLAMEGQYVKVGQPIYRLADLSTVWLMLEMFPDDAASIRFGQQVRAEVQSLPGESFTGRVAFIDPDVNGERRTVGVRVVLDNPTGKLRIGDYAKAEIEVPMMTSSDGLVFDAELANKWISPRHPHVVSDSPGQCPICGIDLVSGARLGFTQDAAEAGRFLVVPRNAVLSMGSHSIVYVETDPGRFEIRTVQLGAHSADQVVVLNGLSEGDRVATSGNFLIDSQMQLAGNPSLIDPTRYVAQHDERDADEWERVLDELPQGDRQIAVEQRICPVTMMRLGSMGPPPKLLIRDRQVFICCEGCRQELLNEPERYLAVLAAQTESNGTGGSDDSDEAWDLPPLGTPRLMTPAESAPSDETPSRHEHGAMVPRNDRRANGRIATRAFGVAQ